MNSPLNVHLVCFSLYYFGLSSDNLQLHVICIYLGIIPFVIWKSSDSTCKCRNPWWRLQMETFSALLAICAGNSPIPGEFPAQRPVTRSFDVFFDLRLKKQLSKQSWGWWFETLSRPLWRHPNDGQWGYMKSYQTPQQIQQCMHSGPDISNVM